MKRLCIAMLILSGCQAPSTKLALDGMQRASAVQAFVVQAQHDELVRFAMNEARAAAKAAEDEEDVDKAVKELHRKLTIAHFWRRQFDQAEFVREATVGAKLQASRGWFGLATDSLKARLEALKPTRQPEPTEPTPVENEAVAPFPSTSDRGLDKTRPSSDAQTGVQRKRLPARYASVSREKRDQYVQSFRESRDDGGLWHGAPLIPNRVREIVWDGEKHVVRK